MNEYGSDAQLRPVPVPVAHSERPLVLNQYGGSGSGPNIQGMHVTTYMSVDFVRQVPVSQADLQACAEDRYLAPREAGQLASAERHLRTAGITVLCAPPGTGRRTTALKLLQNEVGSEQVYALKPEWSAPDSSLLPTDVRGYLLDLSGLDEDERDPDFTKELADYGRDGLQAGRRLILLVTPSDWTGRWAQGLPVVWLTAPDARRVAERELDRSDVQHDWTLEDEIFAEVWSSNPGLADARRLAADLKSAKREDLEDIVAKFTGWRGEIEGMLNKQSVPATEMLPTRATIWSAALLNGAHYRTILSAADSLMSKLGRGRDVADTLAGPTASKRLVHASLTRDGDSTWHDRNKHDLASAILEQFWDEYPNAHEHFISWAIGLISSSDLSPDEVNTAVAALLTLARRRQDASILDKLGETLTGAGQEAAADALTGAALDPEFGDYVKHRLLRWSKTNGDRARLAALIVSGEFGRKEPAAALIRLRWAAGSLIAGQDRQVVVDAFRNLVASRPGDVERALRGWLGDAKPKWASCAAILSLSSSEQGARAVFALAQDNRVRPSLVAAWQTLVRDDRTAVLVNDRLDEWDTLVGAGKLQLEQVLPTLADVYEPELERASISGFVHNVIDPETLRDHILQEVLHRSWQRHESAAAD